MLTFGFGHRQLGPIGLDIGHYAIKMVQLRRQRGELCLVDAQSAALPPLHEQPRKRSDIVSCVRRLLERGAFRGKEVVCALPGDHMKITSVRSNQDESARTGADLYKEAAYRFGLDPEKDAIRYMPAGQVGRGDQAKHEMILFAVDNETICERISLLENMSLEPIGLDPMPCALFRCYDRHMRRQSDQASTCVYLDVGYDASTVVLGRQGQIFFVKQIPLGTRRFDTDIARRLGIDLEDARALRHGERNRSSTGNLEAGPAGRGHSAQELMVQSIAESAKELAQEVSLCLRYYSVTFRGCQTERVVVSGGGMYEPELIQTLSAQLPCAVQRAEPFRGLICPKTAREEKLCVNQGEFTVSCGLALKGMVTPEEDPIQNQRVSLVTVG